MLVSGGRAGAGRGGGGAAGVRAHAAPRPARHRPGGRGQGQLPGADLFKSGKKPPGFDKMLLGEWLRYYPES